MLSFYPSNGREYNHELAVFRHRATRAEPFISPSWADLEPSDGRDCRMAGVTLCRKID